MPWIPKPGALRRWRDYRRLTVPELCKRTRNKHGKHGVSERSVRNAESEKPQGAYQDATINALVRALSEEKDPCHAQFLAWWRRHDGTMAPEDPVLIDPTLGIGSVQSLPIAAKTAPKSGALSAPLSNDDERPTPQMTARMMEALRRRPRPAVEPALIEPEPSGLEIQRPLTSTSEIERAIGQHNLHVDLPAGSFPVIGCDWLHELETQYAEYVGRTFAVVGLVRDTRPIPQRAVAVLNAESGRGATYVKIGRIASGHDPSGHHHKVDVWPTVFAPKGDHGKALLHAHKSKLNVAALVHIVIEERRVGATREDTWEGFFWYEKGKPSPKPWAFVVDEVIVGDISLRPGENRAA